MKTVTIKEAVKYLNNIIDDTIKSGEKILITSNRGNVVLLSEGEFKTLQETLYLLSKTNMRNSLIEEMNTKLDESEDTDVEKGSMMTVKEKLEILMAKYGIETTEKIDPRTMNFGYSPGISDKYVNKELRKRHRSTMSMGVRNYGE